MANYIPLQIDRDTGHIVAKPVQGIRPPAGFYFTYGYVHVVQIAALEWLIEHNGNTSNVTTQIFDENGFELIPDELQIVDDDTVAVRFTAPQAGKALLVLFFSPND